MLNRAIRTVSLDLTHATARWLVALSLLVACSSSNGDPAGPDPSHGGAGVGGSTGGSSSAGGTGGSAGAPIGAGSGGTASGASAGGSDAAGSGGAPAEGRDAATVERSDGGVAGAGGRPVVSDGGRTDGSRGGGGNIAAEGGARPEAGVATPSEAGAASSYNPCPPAGRDCTIMPLGDSITDGFTVRGGYRIPFFQGAHREGKQFTFVGSAVNGPTTVDGVPFPQHHEGHSAHTMYDAPNAPIPRLGISRYIPTSIPQFHPDIVLLMIGTNDVDGNVDLPNAPNRLGMLIDSIIALDAHTLIVVAQITPTMQDPLNQGIVTFNAGIPAVVKSRADAGKHVVMVDMYNAFTKDPAYKSKYLADRLHPNAAGYQVMSDVWNTVVHDLLH